MVRYYYDPSAKVWRRGGLPPDCCRSDAQWDLPPLQSSWWHRFWKHLVFRRPVRALPDEFTLERRARYPWRGVADPFEAKRRMDSYLLGMIRAGAKRRGMDAARLAQGFGIPREVAAFILRGDPEAAHSSTAWIGDAESGAEHEDTLRVTARGVA